MTDEQYLIGFSNVYEQNPFTRALRESLEALAAERPEVELMVRDNDRDTQRAIQNSRDFAAAGVDVGIVFHIDQRAGESLASPLRNTNTPIISVDVPIDRTFYFGLDNERVGREGGEVLADWINRHWDGQLDKTLVVADHKLLTFFQNRVLCALDVLDERVPAYDEDHTIFVDNGETSAITAERVGQVFDRWQGLEHIAVVSLNDDFAVGALQAIRERGRAGQVAMMSHDGTEIAQAEFARDDNMMVVSTLLDPAEYAERLIDLALKLVRNEAVEQWNYANTTPMTPDNYHELLGDGA